MYIIPLTFITDIFIIIIFEIQAISQRDVNYYSFLNGIKEELETKIIQFFESHIQNKFFNRNCMYKIQTFLHSEFYSKLNLIIISDVFDIYVTRNRERVWLIDFNPFGPMTDSLMYTWE